MAVERTRLKWVVCGLVGLCLGVASDAWAQAPVWTLLPFQNNGVDSSSAATFQSLLQVELAQREGVSFHNSTQSCQDAVCAQTAGAAAGAEVAVFGSLSTLGSEIVVTATAVDVPSGEVMSAQRMTVDRVEELDTAAERIAEAISEGSSTEDTAQLGNITHEEAQPALRREGDFSGQLRLGGIIPLGDNYADGTVGMAIDLTGWYETIDFSIEPRIGVRFSVNADDNSYFELPIDIGFNWFFSQTDISPFVGGGAGVHYLHESRETTLITGTIIRTEQHTVLEDQTWGFGMYARTGLMFLRTYSTRLAVVFDYNLVLLEVNDRNNPQSFTFGVGVIF